MGMEEKRGGRWMEGGKGFGGVWCAVAEKQRKVRE
jgi:hypothetical protein